MEFGYSAHLSRDSGVRADPPTAERELANLAALRGKAYSMPRSRGRRFFMSEVPLYLALECCEGGQLPCVPRVSRIQVSVLG